MSSPLESLHAELVSWDVRKAVQGVDQVSLPPALSRDAWLCRVLESWKDQMPLVQGSGAHPHLSRLASPMIIPERFDSVAKYQSAFYRPAMLEIQAAVIQALAETRKFYPFKSAPSQSKKQNNQPGSQKNLQGAKEVNFIPEGSSVPADHLCIIADSDSLLAAENLHFGVSIWSPGLAVKMRVFNPKQIKEGQKYYIATVCSLVSASRELSALAMFSKIRLAQEILLGSSDASAKSGEYLGRHPESSHPASSSFSGIPHRILDALSERLNQSQYMALMSVMGPYAPKISLIQGPPGTGKTATLHAILNCLHVAAFQKYFSSVEESVKSGRMSIDDREWFDLTKLKPRIIVCAPSNVAIDNIVERISDNAFIDGEGRRYLPEMVRVGRGVSDSASVSTYSLDRQVDKVLGLSGEDLAKKLGKGVAKTKHFKHAILENRAKLMCLAKATPEPLPPGFETRIQDTGVRGVYEAYYVDHNRQVTGAERPPTATGGLSLQEMPEWNLYVRELMRVLELWESEHWKTQRLKLYQSFLQRGSPNAERYLIREHIETLILNRANIVASTLNSAGLPQVKSTFEFSTLVVDEAAQAVELATLIPLTLGIKQCVLVGDPQQLPATVLAKRDELGNYERSLFERLQRCGVPVVSLNVQYRMHPAISLFPRLVFYSEAALSDSQSVKRPPYICKPEYGMDPFIFFDMISSTEQIGGRGSRSNRAEAKFCVNLYLTLLQISIFESVDLAGKVGIITPYSDQSDLIKAEFNAVFRGRNIIGNEVEVNTIDAFQGKEKDFIILSTVRASDSSVGFLSDMRRMNVAITRAKLGLFVIGSSQALRSDDHWNLLIQQAQGLHNSYIPVTDPMDDILKLCSQRNHAEPMVRVEIDFLLDCFDEMRDVRRSQQV